MGYTTSVVEKGSWVFHTVSGDMENQITKVDELAAANRIYVSHQNRKKCYYNRNGFTSAEWFKLLIYMSNENETASLAGADYAEGKLTSAQIISKYKKELEEFDRKYRIEVIQRTPKQLTPEEVEAADLLYIAESEGMQGAKEYWSEADAYLGGRLQDAVDTLKFAEGDDLRTDTLFAIYNQCFYHEADDTPKTAIIADIMNLNKNYLIGEKASSNLGKLVYFLDLMADPAYFAEFIDGYPEKRSEYSSINPTTGEITVYENLSYVYNLGQQYIDWNKFDGFPKEDNADIEPYITGTWEEAYFMIRELVEYDYGYGVKDYNYSAPNGARSSFPLGGNTVYDKSPEEGWTWYAPNYVTGVFDDSGKMHNIWEIMHARSPKVQSKPVIVVTNADAVVPGKTEAEPTTYYYYTDAYSRDALKDYTIQYKVEWTPEEVKKVTALSQLTVKKEDTTLITQENNPSYKKAYSFTVTQDYLDADGEFIKEAGERSYLITAVDSKGNTDTVKVQMITRETFELN